MRVAVRGAWVADNLQRLGEGAFYHLAYPTHQVHPQVLEKLRAGTPKYGRVEIHLLRERLALHIADAELIAVHWFPELIRVHFMIARLYVESLHTEVEWEDPDHLVLPTR